MIEIYTKDNCSFCSRAKELLRNASIPFTEMKLDRDFTREILLEKYPNAKSYPVVVVDGFHIGGYSQLNEMIQKQVSDTKRLLNEEI